MSALEEVRAQLPGAFRSAEELHDRLLGFLASLPVAPTEEAETEDDLPAGAGAELRTALECALHDYLRPLIEVLGAALRRSGEPE